MVLIKQGMVREGAIVLPDPLALPDGTEVVVSIAPLRSGHKQPTPEEVEQIAALPFFGMWADREDMADSVAWVRKIREQWLDRLNRQD
jgi:hypothetical protein